MADVRPFCGWRYNFDKVGTPEDVLAPPYDVMSLAEAEELRARHPHHVAHLVLGLPPEEGHHGEAIYAQAAAKAAEFKADATLIRDSQPALYRLTQAYTGPDGAQRSRHGVVTALRLYEFTENVVLPHEETFAKPVEDRLRLMRDMDMTADQIFALFDDPSGAVRGELEASAGPCLWSWTDPNGAVHSLARIEGSAAIEAIRSGLAPLRVFVADGHHRYTASLARWRELGCPSADDPKRGAAAHITACLSDMSDPGLGLFATHRLLRKAPPLCVLALPSGVELSPLTGPSDAETLTARLDSADGPAWILVTQDATWLARVTDDAAVDALMDQSRAAQWRALDLTILHSVLLPALISKAPQLVHDEENLLFARNADEAVARARSGEVGLAVLTRPPTLAQLRGVCEAGERMPHKSTFFYPKVPSGAVCRDLVGGVSDS